MFLCLIIFLFFDTFFQAGVGRLEFKEGDLYSLISIDIIDNTVPEDDKTFYVTLLNPTGGATLSVAATVTVVIRSSDGAYGKFQFSDASLNVATEEIGDSGFITVLLQVCQISCFFLFAVFICFCFLLFLGRISEGTLRRNISIFCHSYIIVPILENIIVCKIFSIKNKNCHLYRIYST